MFGIGKRFKPTRINTLIGYDTRITGDVRFRGGLHIDGRVEGNVIADGDEDSVLTLSEKGVVVGEVRVARVILNGTVNGDVHASHRVELAPQARVSGNVYYNLIEMAMGAEVNGNMVHNGGGEPPMLAYDADAQEPAPVVAEK